MSSIFGSQPQNFSLTKLITCLVIVPLRLAVYAEIKPTVGALSESYLHSTNECFRGSRFAIKAEHATVGQNTFSATSIKLSSSRMIMSSSSSGSKIVAQLFLAITYSQPERGHFTGFLKYSALLTLPFTHDTHKRWKQDGTSNCSSDGTSQQHNVQVSLKKSPSCHLIWEAIPALASWTTKEMSMCTRSAWNEENLL